MECSGLSKCSVESSFYWEPCVHYPQPERLYCLANVPGLWAPSAESDDVDRVVLAAGMELCNVVGNLE